MEDGRRAADSRRRWIVLACILSTSFPLQADAEDGWASGPSLEMMLGGGGMPGTTTTCVPCSTMTPALALMPAASSWVPASVAEAPDTASTAQAPKKFKLSPAQIGGITAGSIGAAAVTAGAIAGSIIAVENNEEKKPREADAEQTLGFLSSTTSAPSVTPMAKAEEGAIARNRSMSWMSKNPSLSLPFVVGLTILICFLIVLVSSFCCSHIPKRTRNMARVETSAAEQRVSMSMPRSDTETYPLLKLTGSSAGFTAASSQQSLLSSQIPYLPPSTSTKVVVRQSPRAGDPALGTSPSMAPVVTTSVVPLASPVVRQASIVKQADAVVAAPVLRQASLVKQVVLQPTILSLGTNPGGSAGQSR